MILEYNELFKTSSRRSSKGSHPELWEEPKKGYPPKAAGPGQARSSKKNALRLDEPAKTRRFFSQFTRFRERVFLS